MWNDVPSSVGELYEWAPDSRSLAFLRLDETNVPRYTLVDDVVTPIKVEVTNYPRAGDPNPAARLVESRFPIVRIWQTNQPGATPQTVDLDAGPDRVLVRRRGADLEFVRLPAADFTFARTLSRGTPLGLATDASLAVDPEFDLAHSLRTLIQAGAFARVALA